MGAVNLRRHRPDPRRQSSAKQASDHARDPVGRHAHRLINVDVALSDAACRVPEQGGDGQLGEAEVAGDAGEGVPKHVRRDTLQLRALAGAIEHPDHTDEVALAPIGRKYVGSPFPAWEALDQLAGDRPDDPDLRSAFGIEKGDAVGLRIEPAPLQPKRFKPPEPGQQQEPHCHQAVRMVALLGERGQHDMNPGSMPAGAIELWD